MYLVNNKNKTINKQT